MTGQLQQAVCSFPKEETVYRVLITDAPQPKEHTYLCQALLKAVSYTHLTLPTTERV